MVRFLHSSIFTNSHPMYHTFRPQPLNNPNSFTSRLARTILGQSWQAARPPMDWIAPPTDGWFAGHQVDGTTDHRPHERAHTNVRDTSGLVVTTAAASSREIDNRLLSLSHGRTEQATGSDGPCVMIPPPERGSGHSLLHTGAADAAPTGCAQSFAHGAERAMNVSTASLEAVQRDERQISRRETTCGNATAGRGAKLIQNRHKRQTPDRRNTPVVTGHEGQEVLTV